MNQENNEVKIVFCCPRCQKYRVALFVREGESVSTHGIGFPMGVGVDGNSMAERFEPHEAALCYLCLEGKEEEELRPDQADILRAVTGSN